jgi:predicted nucleic acid-binding protein
MEQKISEVRYLVDTNIFVEFLLDQERADESLQIMERIERGELDAYVTSFALHSIAVILDRRNDMDLLEKFFDRVIQAKGLRVYQTEPIEEKSITTLTRTVKLDFDDTLHYHVASMLGATLMSFDRGFDATDLKRVEPSALLHNE